MINTYIYWLILLSFSKMLLSSELNLRFICLINLTPILFLDFHLPWSCCFAYLFLSFIILYQFSSVTQSCPTLCDPMNRSTPGLSITNSRSSFKLTSIESVMPSSHLIFCHPLLLLPPIPPSISVFSDESTLRMRWPKYWSFSFSIIPSKEISGLISFRMD